MQPIHQGGALDGAVTAEEDAMRQARLAIAAIASHPRMPAARRLYLREFLDLYGGNPFLGRLLLEQGRFFVHFITVHLFAGHEPDRRETWPTVGALKQRLAAFGFASPRQVDHLIGRLQDAGFLSVQPAPDDRRVRLLLPTEAMLGHDRRWLAVHHAPMTVLWPERDYTRVMHGDPDFQLAHRRESARRMAAGLQIMASVPETMLFFNHAGGHMVRSALLWTAMENENDTSVAVPYAELASRFGVSRTQVRVILRGAEALELVRLVDRGGRRVELTPKLWASYDEGLAGGFYMHEEIYQTLR